MEESIKHENIKAELRGLLDRLPTVYNMESERGNDIPNQFIIRGNGWVLFQSYRSPIALKKGGKTYLFNDWNYSVTTGKYRNQFLNETKKETEAKIKNGEYIVVEGR